MTERTRWQTIARRIRVPLGFVFAAVFLWLARPTWVTMAASLVLVVPGVWLRAYAAGYVRKNAELTRTGPYAHTRNPLYLGSMMIAFGFAAASGSWIILIALAVLFAAIYVPTIQSEEVYLREHFADFDEYAAKVPRLLPRMTAAAFPANENASGGRFSAQQWRHHREYNAAMGAGAIYAALAVRLFLHHHGVMGVCAEGVEAGAKQPTNFNLCGCCPLLKLERFSLALFLLVSGCIGSLPARAQLLGLGPKPTPQPVVIPTLQPPQPGFVFPAKQTLTFTVDWRVFTAGTAVFQIEQQGTVQKITATADTVGAVTLLFPVVDKFQAGFDNKTGCSTGFTKHLQEGRRKVSSELSFDYGQGRQRQVEKNLIKGTSKELTASIPACVTDSLSAIFYAASQPMVVGQSIRFPLADSMRTVTVAMKVEAREEIKTPAGTFQTIRVEPTADEGIVKNRGSIWVWYTDDARHMPVQIRARLLWGTITFHLQSFEDK